MSRNGKAGETQDTVRQELVSMDSAVQFVLTNVPRSQLLEMYYWTQEQDILRIVRGLVTLPQQTRHELVVFLDQLEQHRRAQMQRPQANEPLMDHEDEDEDEAKPYILPH